MLVLPLIELGHHESSELSEQKNESDFDIKTHQAVDREDVVRAWGEQIVCLEVPVVVPVGLKIRILFLQCVSIQNF